MKQYSGELLQEMKERQSIQDYYGLKILVKNIPDCDERGTMDPRRYKDTKKGLRMIF